VLVFSKGEVTWRMDDVEGTAEVFAAEICNHTIIHLFAAGGDVRVAGELVTSSKESGTFEWQAGNATACEFSDAVVESLEQFWTAAQYTQNGK
jgi:hypothetical protein